MRFHCLQHVPFETPGSIETWIENKRYSLSFTRFYDNEPLPRQDEFDALVIMGGPMSIHDENIHPWLVPEKSFIRSAMDHQKKIIAICLGAQLVAAVAGSAVYETPDKEIGFFPVQFTEAAQRSQMLTGLPAWATVFHWHGETFDLPPEAIHLAFTATCTNQGFLLHNHVLGLQFHPELTPGIVRDMIRYEGHELVPAPFIQPAETILQNLHELDRNRELLFGLLNDFIG
jgi:GMP synthase-like glutamine amidotransferase